MYCNTSEEVLTSSLHLTTRLHPEVTEIHWYIFNRKEENLMLNKALCLVFRGYRIVEGGRPAFQYEQSCVIKY